MLAARPMDVDTAGAVRVSTDLSGMDLARQALIAARELDGPDLTWRRYHDRALHGFAANGSGPHEPRPAAPAVTAGRTRRTL